MSKVKDYLLPVEIEKSFWEGYEKYLDEISQSPTAIELDQLELQCLAKSHSVHTSDIVAQVVNNIDYYPKQGA